MIRPRHIHEIRAITLWVVRLLAAGLIVYGCYLITARLLFGLIGNGNIKEAFTLWLGIGSDHGMYRGLPMVGAGVILVVMGPKLVRWIITVPESGCPRCGYPGSGKCPECGLDVVDGVDQQA